MSFSNYTEAPTAAELFSDPSAGFIAFVAVDCACFLMCAIVTLYNVAMHVRAPPPANLSYKTSVIVVIFTPLVMSFLSLCCLFFPRATVVLELVQSAFEAFALWRFFITIRCMLGGQTRMTEILCSLPPKNYYAVPPFKLCCGRRAPFQFTPAIIRKLKIFILQICVTRPLMLVVAILLLAAGKYQDGVISSSNGYVFVALINAAALLLTMYALLVVFFATRQVLAAFSTTYKFLMIKVVFLLAIVQNLLFSLLVRVKAITPNSIFSNPELAEQWLNWVIVIEVAFISLLFLKAFPASDFALVPKKGELHETIGLSLAKVCSGTTSLSALQSASPKVVVKA